MMAITDKNVSQKCIHCDLNSRKQAGFKNYVKSDAEATELNELVNIGDFVCTKCRAQFTYFLSKRRKQELQTDVLATNTEPESQGSEISTSSTTLSQETFGDNPSIIYQELINKEESEFVELSFRRPISTHKYCFLCDIYHYSSSIQSSSTSFH